MTVLKDLPSHARKSGAPATYVLIGLLIASFLGSWLFKDSVAIALAFVSADFQIRPWSLLTYPFAVSGGDLVGTAFSCLWLYWIATSVERELGTWRYLAFFAALALIPLGLVTLGASMLGLPAILAGPYLAIAGITVAWATRNPHATMLLAMIIPVQAWVLGWITAALVVFGYGWEYQAPLMGVFAAMHLWLAYLYAANKLKFLPWGMVGATSRGSATGAKQMRWEKQRDDQYFDDVKRREQEREERERLRKLFESSMKDDGPDR